MERQMAVTAVFVGGASLFGVVAYLSYVKVVALQARAEECSEAMRNNLRKRLSD